MDFGESEPRAKKRKETIGPDLFQVALLDQCHHTVLTLQSMGFLAPCVSPSVRRMHLAYATHTISQAVEIWMLHFGPGLEECTLHQFQQCFARVQAIGDVRFRYGIGDEETFRLFTLVTRASGASTLTLPQLALVFMWLGPPDDFALSATTAINRAYQLLQHDEYHRTHYYGFCSRPSIDSFARKSAPSGVVTLVEGGYTFHRSAELCVRHVVHSAVLSSTLQHKLIFSE